MIEDELGAMFKHAVQLAEDRNPDYAVGKAVRELVAAAMNAVIEAQIGGLSPAERLDLESGIVDGMEWSPDDKQAFVDALADPPAPSEHLWQAADRYGRR